MKSKNMNYVFNVEYFETNNLFPQKDDDKKKAQATKFSDKNKEIEKFVFETTPRYSTLKNVPGYSAFSLYTAYPGLMVGVGNPHELAIDGAIKFGFSFDYVSGVPYIPGSEVKGMLRSYFPGNQKTSQIIREYEQYIKNILKNILKNDDIDVLKLKSNIFDNGDIFIGAYPVLRSNADKSMLKMEYITSHTTGKFKNPNPVSVIKVKPNVEFEFVFILKDYYEDEKLVLDAEGKLKLFKQIISDMGIGAKTNVGFGRFSSKQLGG